MCAYGAVKIAVASAKDLSIPSALCHSANLPASSPHLTAARCTRPGLLTPPSAALMQDTPFSGFQPCSPVIPFPEQQSLQISLCFTWRKRSLQTSPCFTWRKKFLSLPRFPLSARSLPVFNKQQRNKGKNKTNY